MFQGLSTALTALYAQRAALETTGNNIANVNTDGYSRQRVTMSPSGGSAVPAFFSTSSGVGTGVNLDGIERLRDQFIEARALTEHGRQGQLDKAQEAYQTIELAFGEPGDAGLQSQLSVFWASWDDLANNPGDSAARAQVTGQAQTLVSGFNQVYTGLEQLSTASIQDLKGHVGQINSLAKNVADLNDAIRTAVEAGASPNSLMDQRDLLVNKMAEIGGVTTQATSSGAIAVNFGGMSIVRDNVVTNLEVDDSGTPLVLRWDNDANPLTTTNGFLATPGTGAIAGLLGTINTAIPKYQTMIDGVASKLITEVNTAHTAGFDQDGTAGVAFFTGTTARDISVSAAIVGNSRLVAASSSATEPLGAENARRMANMASSVTGADSDYRRLVDTLGVEAQRSYRQVEIQQSITDSVDSARMAVSGVNLDEEMSNLVRYQRAYESAAKYLAIMDEVLGSLINMV